MATVTTSPVASAVSAYFSPLRVSEGVKAQCVNATPSPASGQITPWLYPPACTTSATVPIPEVMGC